jgi:hypothetical protein
LVTALNVLAAVLVLAGSAHYIWSIVRSDVTPNLVTWGLWALIPLITFVAEQSEQVGIQSLLVLAASLGPLAVVVVAGLYVRRYWHISAGSVLCGCLALAALGVWLATRDGRYGVALSVLADLGAALPTLAKAIRVPESESGLVFFLGAVGGAIVVSTLGRWTVASGMFPTYVVILNGLLAVLVWRRGFGRGGNVPRSRFS